MLTNLRPAEITAVRWPGAKLAASVAAVADLLLLFLLLIIAEMDA